MKDNMAKTKMCSSTEIDFHATVRKNNMFRERYFYV